MKNVIAVIHLCFAFAALLWVAGYPFTGELLAIKSRKVLYEQALAEKHTKRFAALPKEKQQRLLETYEAINQTGKRSFTEKLHDAIKIAAYGPSSFGRAWIAFSIVIGLLILLEYPGAGWASWLLPLIAIAFVFDNFYEGFPHTLPPDAALFPTEEYLTERYLEKPLSTAISDQYHELKEAWNRYLIAEWADETPSNDPAIRSQQKDTGEFAFLLARLETLPSFKLEAIQKVFHKRQHPFLLGFYVFWNLLFACLVNRPKKLLKSRCTLPYVLAYFIFLLVIAN